MNYQRRGTTSTFETIRQNTYKTKVRVEEVINPNKKLLSTPRVNSALCSEAARFHSSKEPNSTVTIWVRGENDGLIKVTAYFLPIGAYNQEEAEYGMVTAFIRSEESSVSQSYEFELNKGTMELWMV